MTSRLLTPDRLKFRCDGKKIYYTEEIDVPEKYDIQEVIDNTRKMMMSMLKDQPHRLRLNIKNKRTIVASLSLAYKKKTHAFAMIVGELLGTILNEDPEIGNMLLQSVPQFVAAYHDDVMAQRRIAEKLYGIKPIETVELSTEEKQRLLGTEILDGTSNQFDFGDLIEAAQDAKNASRLIDNAGVLDKKTVVSRHRPTELEQWRAMSEEDRQKESDYYDGLSRLGS